MFLEALDEALGLLVGEVGKRIIYYHLQKTYSINMKDVPEKPEVLVEFLNAFFGYGAKVIEKAIVKSLCDRVGLDPLQYENIGLLDLIRKIQQRTP